MTLDQPQSVPFLPENAPFSPAQRAWLNGFLAGLFSQTHVGDRPVTPTKKKVPIYYGSETGNAEAFAKRAAKAAVQRGFDSAAVRMDKVNLHSLASEQFALFVTSTYGDGDPPANAKNLHAELMQPSPGFSLSHLQYSVLALGDTNYEQFCKCGKDFDQQLVLLGAKRLFERIDCDVDFEKPAQNWLDGVFSVLEAARPPDDQDKPSRPAADKPSTVPSPVLVTDSAVQSTPRIGTKDHPFSARLLVNRRLNQNGSEKETRHFEIALGPDGPTYEVGDALGIFPTNCPQLVDEILLSLGCDGEEAVAAPDGPETSLRHALSHCYDLNRIPSAFLKEIASRTGDPDLHALLAPANATTQKRFLEERDLLDFLLEYPGLTLQPAELVTYLRKLQPRLYSIASSLKAVPGEVHLTVSIVRYHLRNRGRKGICSTFLADRLSPEGSLLVFTHHSPHFRLPTDPSRPIIMIGPGTGIAPFRAFLQERQAIGASGANWLFFGEQRSDSDFYYQDELSEMVKKGILTRLNTAFSRDQAHKIYVQHRLLEHAAEVWNWLQTGAHVYVCGDAKRMAKDVDNALRQICQTAGNLSDDQTEEYIGALRRDKRYQRDVY
jgi:sulfite reductase (NADPH) flavoprotein alpha-component